MRLFLLCSVLLMGGAAAGCGDNHLAQCGDGTKLVGDQCVGSAGPTCGPGTTLVNGECVGSAGTTCGSGTTLVNGMCVATPPTPVGCGPGTMLQGDTCVIDPNAPAPVTALAATVSGSSVNLSWTAGTGSAQTLVARLVAGAYDAPAAHTSYTVGQTLPGGATVIAVGSGITATDAFTTPGRFTYMAWSQNASGNYGFGREVSVMSLPAQTATVAIDVNAGTATVTAQPANLMLATANFAFDAGTGTASFDLSATNNTVGHLFNIKAVIATPTLGTVAGPTGTTDAGDPFVTLGTAASLPGDTVTRTVSITGLTATDTTSLPITITESGLAMSGSMMTDAAGGSANQLQLPSVRGSRTSVSYFSDGWMDPSGRYFFGLTRWTTALYRVDTASGDVAAVSPGSPNVGHAMCGIVGPDGFAYLVYAFGSHRGAGRANALQFMKVDPSSMTTVAASAQFLTPNSARAPSCALHGSTLAIAYGTDVYLGDLSTMTFVDTDPTTTGVIDPIATSSFSDLRHLVFSNDGATIYASEINGARDILAIDAAAYTSSVYHTASGNVYSLTIDSAGTLWWGSDNGLYSFDGTTETAIAGAVGGTTVRAIGPRTGNTVFVSNKTASFLVDVTTGDITHVSSHTNDSRQGHTVAVFATP